MCFSRETISLGNKFCSVATDVQSQWQQHNPAESTENQIPDFNTAPSPNEPATVTVVTDHRVPTLCPALPDSLSFFSKLRSNRGKLYSPSRECYAFKDKSESTLKDVQTSKGKLTFGKKEESVEMAEGGGVLSRRRNGLIGQGENVISRQGLTLSGLVPTCSVWNNPTVRQNQGRGFSKAGRMPAPHPKTEREGKRNCVYL